MWENLLTVRLSIFLQTGMACGTQSVASFSVTYDFLAMEDINRDRIQDVVFLYKNTNSTDNSNQSCADEGIWFYLRRMSSLQGAGSLFWVTLSLL